MYSPGIKSRATRFVNVIEKPPPSASAGAAFTVPSFEFRTKPASANPNGETLALLLAVKTMPPRRACTFWCAPADVL
jgi:hypothetical protein